MESGSKPRNVKHRIDFDTAEKKSSRRGIWAATSVVSKKWQKWRQKEKKNKSDNTILAAIPLEKPISRQYRETQSEITDYGLGRRSCDFDPRFSLDVGRISFDCPRYSLDEPRASWDRHLIRSFSRMAPIVSAMGDAQCMHVLRSEMQIADKEPSINCDDENEGNPGGSAQTRDYYLDSSSSRRRKSLDRSNSIRSTASAVVAEIDEMKSVSTAKVLPTSMDVLGGKIVMKDSSENHSRGDSLDIFEFSSGFRDGSTPAIRDGERKELKKTKRWKWRLWSFMHKHYGGSKNKDEDKLHSQVNWLDRSLSASWQDRDIRSERNGEVRGGFDSGKMLRSNSSVSWRNSSHIEGSFVNARKSNAEINDVKMKRGEFLLERNTSARHSYGNESMRIRLAPSRSCNRGGGLAKNKPNGSHSIRNIFRLY